MAATFVVISQFADEANADDPAPDGLAERFETVVFFNEFSGKELPLLRWELPLNIYVYGDGWAAFDDHLKTTILDLSALTGLPVMTGQQTIRMVRAGWPTLEAIRRQYNVLTELPPFLCAGQLFGTSPLEVTGAVILIRNDLSAEMTRICIVQELTQILGLPNDIDDPTGTVFSSYSIRETLSDSDRKLLRILYDERLRTGMTRGEAMPIIERIAAEISD